MKTLLKMIKKLFKRQEDDLYYRIYFKQDYKYYLEKSGQRTY